METVFTPKLLAERWGCSAQTVRDAITDGTLSGFRVGRLMRVRDEAVLAFERRS